MYRITPALRRRSIEFSRVRRSRSLDSRVPFGSRPSPRSLSFTHLSVRPLTDLFELFVALHGSRAPVVVSPWSHAVVIRARRRGRGRSRRALFSVARGVHGGARCGRARGFGRHVTHRDEAPEWREHGRSEGRLVLRIGARGETGQDAREAADDV